MPSVDSLRRRFLLGVFVVSGFTGLIYESIWSQYLKLFLGHAGYAQTLVLTIFMGGLAVGSWVVAKYSGRMRHLLWGYLLVEGLTGVLGIVFHPVFVAASDFSYDTVIPSLPPGVAIHAYKWLLGALLILPQSVLLGMTFPLISGGMIRRWPERPGETLAVVYFTNSLGAGIGVLVAGFVMIDAVGLPGTVLTAGLLNIVLALAVWFAVRAQDEPAPEPRAVAAQPSSNDSVARWFATAAFLTGAASFMYELGWIRMLSQVLGSSTHSFELMLSAFILGLAFGGLHVRKRIERIEDPERYLGVIMISMGSLAALTLPAYNASFDVMAWALHTFTRTASGYVAFNVASQTIAALIMVPATFCAGMTLPLLTHALMRRGTGEESIGRIYSLNTVGSICGVALTVHLLMPLIGVKGVILSGAGIHIALGLSRLIRFERSRRLSASIAMAASVAVFVFATLVVKLDPARMASGVFRTGFATVPRTATVTYLRDGKTATVSLIKQYGQVSIATNGKSDAMINMGKGQPSGDETTMVMAAAIPLSMHSHPNRVANIGFGSGLTADVLLSSPLVKRLDSIEIEPVMVTAARKGFSPRVHSVFEDPRSHIVYEDAKTYFATTREPYDLIVSEPSNPWVSGVASLFSDEFYARIVHYLTPDGMFVQWIQTYETDIGVIASVLKSLAPHFGTYAIYRLDDSDILILATRGSSFATPDDRLLQSPRMRSELARIGVPSAAAVQSRRIGDSRLLAPLFASIRVPPNSDFFPFVDNNAARLRFLREEAGELAQLNIAPLPFLDFLAGDAAPGPTPEPSAQSGFVRDGVVRRALAIHHAIATGKLEALDESSAASALLIDLSASRCAESEGRNAWMRSIRWVSDSTAAYLSEAELAEIWNKIRASTCYRDVAGQHRTWADLYAAVAARDAASMVKFGTELLGTESANSRDQRRTYLTTVVAAAYVRMGQLAQAHNLLQAQSGRLDTDGYDFLLRELSVLSQSPRDAKVALAKP
jgi:spermidine synthase